MNINICDSNELERKKYLDFFRTLAEKENLEVEFHVYSRSEEMLFHFDNRQHMDILFIDIELPGMSGIEAAIKLRDSGYRGEIIFLTKLQDKQYILAGYNVGAMHYIIKEETPSEKIIEIFQNAVKAAELKEQKYILVTAANKWANIPINSIRYFEIYKKIVTVYYGNQTFEFHSQSLEIIERQLKGLEFVRTHRSYLVALKEIKNLSYYTLTTRNGKSLPVGRTHYRNIKAALESFAQIQTIL